MLTPAEVERIARLARLSLTEEEASTYARQLSAVLDYAAELSAVDVDDIPPTANVLPVRSVTRDGDAIGAQTLAREDALANAPLGDGAHFRVPATLGGDEGAAG